MSKDKQQGFNALRDFSNFSTYVGHKDMYNKNTNIHDLEVEVVLIKCITSEVNTEEEEFNQIEKYTLANKEEYEWEVSEIDRGINMTENP